MTDLYEDRLADGELVAARCLNCDTMSFPPADRCQCCDSARQRPLVLSGRARLCTAELAECPGGMSLGRVLLDEGICVSAPLVGAFGDAEVLRQALQNKPVEVQPAVLRIQGLTILAFAPG
ncbi:MAG: Zn-ribbon domain-containing OB-fold protein [Persicimonas sp.]